MNTALVRSLAVLCLLGTIAAHAAQDIEKLPADRLPKVNPPASVAHGQAPLRIRVLVLDFNPLIPGKLYAPDQADAPAKGLREVGGWNNPLPLAAGYMQDICDASGGFIQFEIVEWLVVRRFQQKVDGFTYTPETYMAALKQGTGQGDAWHQPDGVDYPHMIAEFNIAPRIDAGEIDEVWMMGLPYFGYYESCMAGPEAFNINGGTFPQVPVRRRFAIMGFNVERGVAEMLEDQCHRTEATMTRIYGGWESDRLDHNWARFAANEHQSGTAAVGSCHYPPNGVRDYDFASEKMVESSADDWLDYPRLTGTKKRTFNREEWAGPHKNKKGAPDYHRNYIRWWFTHLPKAPGVNEDGRLNNWWAYVYNFNAYDERGKPLAAANEAQAGQPEAREPQRPR